MLRHAQTARATSPYGPLAPGVRAHTVEQIRTAEQQLMATVAPGTLMRRAATGLAVEVADWVLARRGRLAGSRVLLVVGSGNNGGDALYAGAWLARRGVAVRWLATGTRLHAEGRSALEAAGGREMARDQAPGWAEVALDAVLGIGGRPGLDPATAALFDDLAAHEVPVIAVDLPSGVEVDTGATPASHVRAAMTVTFGTHKVATLVDPAAAACGQVRLVDIGLETWSAAMEPAVTAVTGAGALVGPARAAHKYTRGVVGVRAGSSTYPGAALLCVGGAATGLAGMVRFVGEEEVDREVRRRHPEVVGAGRVQAWAVGSGTAERARSEFAAALADGVPVVADADAIAHAAALLPAGHSHRVVLTPHAGELAGLLGVERSAVEERPWEHVRAAARTTGAVVLLKGPRTLVAAPDGRVTVNTSGTPWLATAGAGDVLTGLVGALLAAGIDLLDAASLGAWIHGRAAELPTPRPLIAGDVTHGVREVLRFAALEVGDSKV